jgi:hypothetical protein
MNETMQNFRNYKAVIREVNKDLECYTLDIDSGEFLWQDWMFKNSKKEKINPWRLFIKEQPIDGMEIKLRYDIGYHNGSSSLEKFHFDYENHPELEWKYTKEDKK